MKVAWILSVGFLALVSASDAQACQSGGGMGGGGGMHCGPVQMPMPMPMPIMPPTCGVSCIQQPQVYRLRTIVHYMPVYRPVPIQPIYGCGYYPGGCGGYNPCMGGVCGTPMPPMGGCGAGGGAGCYPPSNYFRLNIGFGGFTRQPARW